MLKRTVYLVLVSLILLSIVAAACSAPATPAPKAEKKLKVFGAFATPIEEPWDGVIHAALQKAKEEGKIEYTYTENIGYAVLEGIARKVRAQRRI
jgi:hypothetical protein